MTDPLYQPKYLSKHLAKKRRSIEYLLQKKADYKFNRWYEGFGRAELLNLFNFQ